MLKYVDRSTHINELDLYRKGGLLITGDRFVYIFERVIFNSRKGRSPRHLTQVMGFVHFDLKLIVLTLNCQTLYSAGNYRLYYT